jgi:hypothetical protein
MKIRYYVHAWQALLMFMAGLLCILAAFAGYIQAGGGEELLRRAISKLQTGRAQFDSLDLRWRTGELVAKNLRHDDFQWPQDKPLVRFSGLLAREFSVKLDLLPWPPAVRSITIREMPETAIEFTEGFVQLGTLKQLRYQDIPPIRFVDCNLRLKIAQVGPLHLSGCGGELRPGTATEPPHGAFSLRQLDGRPFNIKLDMLEDGSWVLTGNRIQINTRAIKAASNPFADQLDPAFFLVRALFSGEMGAEGTVTALRMVVQPPTATRSFICDGTVGYSNLEFRLPKPGEATGRALPFWLDRLLGAGESYWPQWMQVDSITTGGNGRVAFHMADGTLNFACDEGPGSAFIGSRQGRMFPPVESLKGAVATDEEQRPRHILLRGFLGNEFGFETRVERHADRTRTYDLLLEPRAAPPGERTERAVAGKPLWRFASRVKDYVDARQLAAPDEKGQRALAEFEVEAEARQFPWPEHLPPAVRDLSGRAYVKGRFTDGQRLCLETITITDGGARFFGAPLRPLARTPADFGPLYQAVDALFGTSTPWEVKDVALRGKGTVQFAPDFRWDGSLEDVQFTSGSLVYAGLSSDWGLASPTLNLTLVRKGDASEIGAKMFAPNKWQVLLVGSWKEPAAQPAEGTFKLVENNVPFMLHPQRMDLWAPYVSEDRRRVNRAIDVIIRDGEVVERKVFP